MNHTAMYFYDFFLFSSRDHYYNLAHDLICGFNNIYIASGVDLVVCCPTKLPNITALDFLKIVLAY